MQFRLVLEIGLSMLGASLSSRLSPSEALISLGFAALLLLPPPPPTLFPGSRLPLFLIRSGSGRAGVAELEWSDKTIYKGGRAWRGRWVEKVTKAKAKTKVQKRIGKGTQSILVATDCLGLWAKKKKKSIQTDSKNY